MDPLPDLSVVKALQVLSWAAGCGNLGLIADPSSIHQAFVKVSLCTHLQWWVVIKMHIMCTVLPSNRL